MTPVEAFLHDPDHLASDDGSAHGALTTRRACSPAPIRSTRAPELSNGGAQLSSRMEQLYPERVLRVVSQIEGEIKVRYHRWFDKPWLCMFNPSHVGVGGHPLTEFAFAISEGLGSVRRSTQS